MINRYDIEAGDKVFTRDGGCLVAREVNHNLLLGFNNLSDWNNNGLAYTGCYHPLDIIRTEKAPKPVVDVITVHSVNQELGDGVTRIVKLVFVNNVWDKEKSEQVK